MTSPRSTPAPAHVGTAGWTLPRASQGEFPGDGTHLQRYATRFSAAEINSSFHRPHRPSTYARWASSVPTDFRFSVKLPRAITHTARLVEPEAPLRAFATEVAGLEEKLGCLLVQLPPSLSYDPAVVEHFFERLREWFGGAVACEPRHPTWFEPSADQLLERWRVARVAADPAKVPAAGEPGGWGGMVYYRLHGSPRVYYSEYAEDALARYAQEVRDATRRGIPAWCIFDNTASGAATPNALSVALRTTGQT